MAPSDLPLRASIARLATARNAGDGAKGAADYRPGGSLTNILGVVYPDASAVRPDDALDQRLRAARWVEDIEATQHTAVSPPASAVGS